MNARKYMALVVGGAIAAVLLAVALVFLFRYQGAFRTVDGKLKSALGRLDQLNRRDPFPSQANVDQARKNRDIAKQYLGEIQGRVTEAQADPDEIEPAQFPPLLENVARKVFARADEAKVKVPEEGSLAFKRYMAGELPARLDIPRLVVQLRTIESVLNLLFEAGIAEIIGIERDIFESGQPDAAAAPEEGAPLLRRTAREAAPRGGLALTARNVPRPPVGELYDVERIYVEFVARESAAWDVLNELARSKLFAVVADVAMENATSTAGVVGGAGAGLPADYPGMPGAAQPVAGAKPGAVAIVPTHEERVVAGREPVKVRLVIDVYRFKKESAKEEER